VDDAREVEPPALASPADLSGLALRCQVDAIAGDALLAFAAALEPYSGVRVAHARADAGAVAALAARIFEAGGAVAPASAAPIYVRDRVALTVQERAGLRAP
jgi:tRNA threonylcarbamoyladenosine biosynthesis protein TsaB